MAKNIFEIAKNGAVYFTSQELAEILERWPNVNKKTKFIVPSYDVNEFVIPLFGKISMGTAFDQITVKIKMKSMKCNENILIDYSELLNIIVFKFK